MTKGKKTIFLYIDGMRYDYVKSMSFLGEYAKRHFLCPVDVEPLHQFEFSIFTSQPQYNHNLWTWFALAQNGDKGPFNWLRYIYRYIPEGPKIRDLISYLNAGLQFLRKETRFVKIGSIPYDVAFRFTTTAKKSFIDHRPTSIKTLFDVLYEHDWQYFLNEWPLCSTNKGVFPNPFLRSNDNIFSELKKKKDKDFVFAHFVTLDSKMHRYGIYAPEVHQELSNLDNGLKSYVEFLDKEINDYNLIICSDHGMVQTVGTVNISSIMQDKRFLLLPDSTSLRVWCDLLDNLQAARELLSQLPHGHVYEQDSFAKIGISYCRKVTGDLMFVADPGYSISPNFYDGINVPKAMHGFLPISDLEACFIVNATPTEKIKRMRLIDICPTILKLMNLPAPVEWQGSAKMLK